MDADSAKIEELTAIIQTVRDRVRSRYPEKGTAEGVSIQIAVADLLPIVHARDAAQAKIAAIGSVNPRAGGLLNKIIQTLKKTVARSLQWFVRDQVVFNRETVSALEAVLESLNDHNRILVSLASQTSEQLGHVRSENEAQARALSAQIDARAKEADLSVQSRMSALHAYVQPVVERTATLESENTELKDIRRHWAEWRTEWERKLATNEIQFLRSVADFQGAFQHRVGQMESNFRDIAKSQHKDYLGALDRANLDIQQRLWDDLEKIRLEYDRLIHSELRVLRQRALVAKPSEASVPSVTFDYSRFAERFRGDEEYVRGHQEFYKPFFAGFTNVLDLGCGRGEFLETMREIGVPTRGIDLGEESIAWCRSKGFDVEVANLFDYLRAQRDGEFDGIMSSQVVEHLAPEALPELARLCAAKLRRGGVLAIETPNPECLAIFATHFYLDPTHTRPVPSSLMAFHMEEAGFGGIEIHQLSPAVESMPEIAELPAGFRKKFFGGLDYAIIGRRL